MVAARLTSQLPIFQSFGSGIKHVVLVLLCLSLFFAQSTPSMAGHPSNAPQGWVEICGDGGSYFIRIGEDGEDQPPTCVHCDTCLGPSVNTLGIPPLRGTVRSLPTPTAIFYSNDRSLRPDCPEQYWSACRGPPIVSTSKTMKTPLSLTFKQPAKSTTNKWFTPCV